MGIGYPWLPLIVLLTEWRMFTSQGLLYQPVKTHDMSKLV